MTDKKMPVTTRRDALKALIYATGGVAALPAMSALSACTPEQKLELSPFMELLIEVSELIIPRTDTPGAIDAGVPSYIEALVGTHYTDEDREAFKTGLAVFDEMAHAKSVKSFLAASDQQRTDILTTLDTSAHPVWTELKQIVAFGYYTSEVAAEELQYDPLPGRYDGDIHLEEVGRAWLTTGI